MRIATRTQMDPENRSCIGANKKKTRGEDLVPRATMSLVGSWCLVLLRATQRIICDYVYVYDEVGGDDDELVCCRLASQGKMTFPLLLGAIPFAVIPSSVWDQLTGNYVFVVGFWGWFLAQFFKIFTKWYKTGIFSPSAFFDSGGMPSSHSSLCSAVTTAVAIHHGLGSTLFAICTCFSVIVMYDAMGVRRHAGLQAQVLNAVVDDLLEGHPISERKLKEVLGHTPRQVMCGAILGLIVGLMFPHASVVV